MEEDILAYTAFLQDYWTWIYSTNIVERGPSSAVATARTNILRASHRPSRGKDQKA